MREACHHNHGTVSVEGFGGFGHDIPIIKVHIAIVSESPDGSCVLDKWFSVGTADDETYVFGLGADTFGHKHVVESVSIVVALDHVGHGVRRDVGAFTAVAQSPAEFVAVAFGHDATASALLGAAAVYVPFAYVGVVLSRLVGDAEVGDATAVEVSYHHIHLRPFRVDAHVSGFGDACIAVLAEHHTDAEVAQRRTAQGTRAPQPPHEDGCKPV